MAAVSAALLAKVDESENLGRGHPQSRLWCRAVAAPGEVAAGRRQQQNGKKKLLHVAPDKR
jgi:hypothetical protein